MRCSRCILPGTTPGITFDEKGVCNYCTSYELKFSNWEEVKEQRYNSLVKILGYAKKLKRPYDCLVALSGGKDSTYTLYLLAEEFRMNCLTVTFDHGFMSNQAKINIKNAVERTGSDHIYYRLPPEKTIDMFGIFFRKTGDFCASCMRGINYAIELAANSYGIPLVVKGSGRRVQYISQIESGNSNSSWYFKSIMKNEQNADQYEHFFSSWKNYELSKLVELMLNMLRIPPHIMMKYLPYYIGIYDYVYEPYKKVVKILKEEMGWSSKDQSIEHLDCLFHDVPSHLRTLRINGITKDTFYNSGLVRQGIITRDEAIRIENQDEQDKSAPKSLDTFLQMCNIPHGQLMDCVNNSDPGKYTPILEKIATALYSRRVLGDKRTN